MVPKKILFSFIVFSCLLSIPIFAKDIVTIAPGGPYEMLAGSTKDITVTITNNGPGDFFSLTIFPPEWLKFKETVIGVEILYNEKYNLELTASPPRSLRPSTYRYDIIVTKRTGETTEEYIYFNVLQPEESAVIKDFRPSCTTCDNIIRISFKVENMGSSKIENTQTIITLDKTIKKIDVGNLDVGEIKEFSEEIYVSKWKPSQYLLVIDLLSNGKYLDSKQEPIVVPVYKDIQVQREVKPSLFGSMIILKATNLGNAEDNAEITDKVDESWWNTYSGPNPDYKGADWTWLMTLNPGETKEIAYTQLFWPAPLSFILLIVFGIFGYMYMNAISINKKILKSPYGTIGVSLHIKNKGKYGEGVVVKDIIPNTFVLTSSFETIKPVVRKSEFGTEVLWRIGNIRPNEERILHYRLKPLNDIVSDAKLPSATLSGNRGNKTFTMQSNSPLVVLGEPKKVNVKFSK